MSKSKEIVEAHKANPKATPAELAALLGVKRTLVYSALRAYARKNGAVKRKVGRPRKMRVLTPPAFPDALAPIKDDARVQRLEQQIVELNAVIRFLEKKVYGASI